MAAHTLTSSSLSSIASSSELRKINGCNFFLQSANSSSLGTSFIGNQLAIRKPNPNLGRREFLLRNRQRTSHAAKFLRANGITLFKVRDETVKLLGKSDMYYFSPEHPPLTEPAQKALDWAVDQKLKSGEDGEVTVTYLLLGLWEQKESAAHQIMADLGFNDEKVKELSKFKLRSPSTATLQTLDSWQRFLEVHVSCWRGALKLNASFHLINSDFSKLKLQIFEQLVSCRQKSSMEKCQ
uniref:Clp R domain-containing protein n=1 Tax=Chenopodium quinoa TaxID=63459 RepID=A0A803MTQ6_CHEQI